MNKTQESIAWLFQIIAASILLPLGVYKFFGGASDVMVFTALDMEPFGRYLIGALEAFAGLCLLSGSLAPSGGILGIGIMLGAALAHASVLGIDAKHLYMLSSVLISCITVVFIRKKQIPLFGRHL